MLEEYGPEFDEFEEPYDGAYDQAVHVRDYTPDKIRGIALSLANDAETTREDLEKRASERIITHILYPSKEEYCDMGGCAFSLPFLTQDREGKRYMHLQKDVWEGKFDEHWIELQHPVQAEWDNLCWITDGGSVWYAGSHNWYYDPFIKIVLRGKEEDVGFEEIAGENIFRQFYNERVQKMLR